jgi:hypothetical protein
VRSGEVLVCSGGFWCIFVIVSFWFLVCSGDSYKVLGRSGFAESLPDPQQNQSEPLESIRMFPKITYHKPELHQEPSVVSGPGGFFGILIFFGAFMRVLARSGALWWALVGSGVLLCVLVGSGASWWVLVRYDAYLCSGAFGWFWCLLGLVGLVLVRSGCFCRVLVGSGAFWWWALVHSGGLW